MGMEGLDQNLFDSSTVSTKNARAVVDVVRQTNQPDSTSAKRSVGDGPTTCHPDPTRFGDWEHAGRCIDF